MWSSRCVVRGSGLCPPLCPLCYPSPALSSALQAKTERNYHIFYEMLAGLPSQQRQRYCLQGAETYYYLNQVLCPLPSPPHSLIFGGLPNLRVLSPQRVGEEDAQGRVTPMLGAEPH